MIEDILPVLTTIAAIAASLAAWFSFMVSKSSHQFQKSYAKNHMLIHDLNRVIDQTETLIRIMSAPYAASDSEISSADRLLGELKSSLERLNIRNNINYKNLRISAISDPANLIDPCLPEVIEKLETIKDNIFN